MEDYNDIRREVERVFGYRPHTSNDFKSLANVVWRHTGVRMSPTTLKRMWGYLDEGVKPSSTTVDVLSRFAGFRDYETFCQRGGQTESLPVLSRHITDQDVAVGQRVRLWWQPDRVCVIRHQGEGWFVVEDALNTRLAPGDTFLCRLIIEHEPLYLTELRHDGVPGNIYKAGLEHGIVFELLEEDDLVF